MGRVRMPPPHGGELVHRVIEKRDYAESLAAGAIEFELKPTSNYYYL